MAVGSRGGRRGAAMTKDGRQLGLVLATVLVAGNMIGSGVYLLPASLAAFGSVSLLGWLGGLAAALVFAAMFASMGTLRPEAGGLLPNIEAAFGRWTAFTAGGVYWLQCVLGNGALAVAVTGYLSALIPGLKAQAMSLSCTIALGWLFVALNLFGPKLVARYAGLSLVLGLLPVLLAGTAGWLLFDPHLFAASWNVSGQSTARILPRMIVLVLWAFSGVECACVAAPLVRNPRRNVPLSTLAGVLLAAAVFISACTAINGVLPAAALAESGAPFVDLAGRMFGGGLGAAVAVCAALKASGTLGGWVLITAESGRQATALADDRPLTPERTPVVQLLVCGAILTAVVALTSSRSIGGQFAVMIDASVLLTLCVYAMAGAALARLSARGAARSRLAVGLGVATAVLVAAIIGVQDLVSIGCTLGAVAVAAAAYPLLRRRREDRVSQSAG